jgi:hypothetical protein
LAFTSQDFNQEGVELVRPFRDQEIKDVIMEMKENSAPGPNGFGVSFFKKFWDILKGEIKAIFSDFHKGILDVKRLNFGVITPVPKVKEANIIKQYRPICLLNVDFKWITKTLTNRLAPIAKKVIGPNQTGFVKGETYLKG